MNIIRTMHIQTKCTIADATESGYFFVTGILPVRLQDKNFNKKTQIEKEGKNRNVIHISLKCLATLFIVDFIASQSIFPMILGWGWFNVDVLYTQRKFQSEKGSLTTNIYRCWRVFVQTSKTASLFTLRGHFSTWDMRSAVFESIMTPCQRYFPSIIEILFTLHLD